MVALCDCSFCGGGGLGSWTVSADGAFAASTSAGSSHGPHEANGAFSGVSADSYITGLQAGVQWDGPVTYTFPTSPANYAGGYSEPAVNNGFVAATAHQANAARDMLGGGLSGPTFFKYGSFASFINLGIAEIASTPGLVSSADIQIANSAQPPTAYAYYPSTDPTGGDVWFGTNAGAADYQSPVPGSFGWATHLHEYGHAFGLKHPHAVETFTGTTFLTMPSDRDSIEFTLMSYRSYVGAPLAAWVNEQFGYAQSLMMYDIATLQFMYGANHTTRSGNTTYSWSPTTGEMTIDGVTQGVPGANRIFLTVWDGDGTDLYDLTNYTTNLTVDLTPGGWSIFSEAQRADLDAGSADTSRIARGNVFNALLNNNDARSYIENASGGTGNDTLTGNAVGNTLAGGGGDDTLYGGAGNNFLSGEAGNDVLIEAGGDDSFNGNAGIDTLDFGSAANGVFVIRPSSVAFGNGADTVHDDIEIIIGSALDDIVVGMALGDTLAGGAGSDIYYGGSSLGTDNDFASGAGDNDHLRGEGGNDGLSGDSGNDTLFGGAGSDSLAGAGDNDTLLGGTEGDNLDGGTGNDLVYGDDGNDTLSGNDGNDTLVGVYGDDVITTGIGTDTVVIWAGGGTDTVVDFANGSDKIELSGFQMRFSDIGVVGGLGGTTLVFGSVNSTLLLSGITRTDVDATDFVGLMPEGPTPFNDLLLGSAGSDSTDGLAGNDFVYGGTQNAADNDSLFGNSGNDTLGGEGGSDTLSGGADNDFALGGAGNDIVSGDAGNDFLMGGTQDDTLYGGADTDTGYGEAGNDSLFGGAGNDALAGGTGNDVFVYSGGNEGTDTILDFGDGADRVLLQGGVIVSSGLGGTVAVLSDGTSLVASNGHSWTGADFI